MPNLLAGCTSGGLANGLQWLNEPASWSISAEDSSLTITPNAPSDFFRPMGDLNAPANDNCCLLYKEVTGDFTATTYTKAKLEDFGGASARLSSLCLCVCVAVSALLRWQRQFVVD